MLYIPKSQKWDNLLFNFFESFYFNSPTLRYKFQDWNPKTKRICSCVERICSVFIKVLKIISVIGSFGNISYFLNISSVITSPLPSLKWSRESTNKTSFFFSCKVCWRQQIHYSKEARNIFTVFPRSLMNKV